MPHNDFIESTNDNIYLNVVFNHDDSKGSEPTLAEYTVTKTQPILDNCRNYYASVIRFDIPLDYVPLMVMPIVPNQPDADKSPLVIGIYTGGGGGAPFPQTIQYIPYNALYHAPVQNDPDGQVVTPYYYIYSFDNFLSMVNIALRAAYIAAGLPAVGPNDSYPYFYYDHATQLINLVLPAIFNGLAPPEIFMNTALKNYLSNFPLDHRANNDPNGVDYVFILTNGVTSPGENLAYNIYGQAITVPPTYYKLSQEYPSTTQWTSMRKIVISTNSIPIRNEFVPSTTRNQGVAVSFPILTDFVPAIENPQDTRSIAYYVPSSQYRLVDMISDNPLYKIDLRLWWEDRKGNLYPIYITQFQQASVKIAFLNKRLYRHSNLLQK